MAPYVEEAARFAETNPTRYLGRIAEPQTHIGSARVTAGEEQVREMRQ
jgi:hypothetical protein